MIQGGKLHIYLVIVRLLGLLPSLKVRMIRIELSLMSFINNWSLPYKIEEKQLIILSKGPVLIVLAEIWLQERFLGGKTNSLLILGLD